ncbi:PepSY domain-containing protein [Fibrisoma montanum]|uniref:PepSY domain-containing protein n=1 Tax=Fibrisoma montanum TaxID=2305895 RepID=A0A418LZ33_9BACT|nr:PepSY domain-containing protein [Fibrisoma montanum]RIV18636.1 PepSY domain-containing protein [Fibrisoma montanum]
MNDIKDSSRRLRFYRKIHGALGGALFIFFTLIAGTGLLLGWKKHSGGLLLAKSYAGASTDAKRWLPIDSLQRIAFRTLRDSVSADLSTNLDRIDIRPQKGMVKFVFQDHYWGIQLDCTTGQVLHIERRRSDFIEHLHDGSYFDSLLQSGDQLIKLTFTTIMGVSLLIFSITGFYLYYGPKRIRKLKQARSAKAVV